MMQRHDTGQNGRTSAATKHALAAALPTDRAAESSN
jgi:hypothetical protein